MNPVHRDIFRAIHEGKWLTIEYRNRQEQVTRHWIGIHSLDIRRRSLSVEGFLLGLYTLDIYDRIYIESILSSLAREQLIVLVSEKNLERLHQQEGEDDLYDLVRYVRSNGASKVASKPARSRALGIKSFSTKTEEAFLRNLTHALENIWLSQSRFTVEKEVAVSQVFEDNVNYSDLFYSGRFDFVVYEQIGDGKYPALVIELDGKEHFEDEVVMARDRKKQEICHAHQMELIRVENTYARRYQHMKRILEAYFKMMH